MSNVQHDSMLPIKRLRSLLDSASQKEVLHEGGYIWRASFSFGAPATPEEIKKIAERWRIPPSYEEFLVVYNGALLYKDQQYGQWGFQLYGTDDVLSKNETWQRLYRLPPSYLVFAESLGDSDVLLLDTTHLSKIPHECYVLDGDTGYPVDTWEPIARSFGEWLDHLIVAQGAKYWRWNDALPKNRCHTEFCGKASLFKEGDLR